MNMNFRQAELYQRIERFSLEQPDNQLSFRQRLAKDNGWSLHYTDKVIEEYKKFVFLAVVAGHPVSPSDQVDQAWHLHLTYTRSYWEEFCPKILQTSLHHEPTRGGLSEKIKFDELYSKTLESYRQFFDQSPPLNIWSRPKDRFGRDLYFQRVNIKQNWVLKKIDCQPLFNTLFRQIKQVRIFLLFVFTSFVLSSCQFISGIPTPIIFTGSNFLAFYIVLGLVSIAHALWLRHYLRLPTNAPNEEFPDLNKYEVAFLAGGNIRMVETAIVSLVQRGYAEVITEKLILKQTVDNTCDPIETAVLKSIGRSDGTVGHILRLRRYSGLGHSIGDRLRRFGLLANNDQAVKEQINPSLLVFVILGWGIICKTLVEYLLHRNGLAFAHLFFVYLLPIFLLIGVLGNLTSPHRSSYGDRFFNDLSTRLKYLRVANSSDIVLAFAVFGRTVLASDSTLSDLYQMLVRKNVGSGDRSTLSDLYQMLTLSDLYQMLVRKNVGSGDSSGDSGDCAGCM